MYRIMIVSLLFCGGVEAGQDRAASCTWKTLKGQRHRLGLSEERLGAMLEQCRRSGLSAKDADALLVPVCAAQDETLPAEAVFTKVEEGLAKKVAVGQVAIAAEARLGCLRRANQLVAAQRRSEGRGEGRGGGKRLVLRTAMALESGLPEEVLQEIFSQYGGRKQGRLGSVLEVAETLQLAGLDAQDTKQILTDLLDRDLNRGEILRAVDYVLAEQHKGRDFAAIHADLWVRSD